MTKVRVKVLFFGMLRDIVGRAEEQIEVDEGARLDSVFERYARQFPRLKGLESSIVLASNHQRSEEHTSELQSRRDLVCRLLLEKKKKNKKTHNQNTKNI